MFANRGSSLSLLFSAAALSACYASHGRDDAGRIGDVPLDTVEDVARDVPRPRLDAPSGEVCARDADCSRGLCVLDRALAAEDRAPVPLVCGAAGTLPPGSECDSNDVCENGLCALAGGCVEPCSADADCRAGERCTEVPVVTGPRALQPASACVRWVDAPTSVRVTDDSTLPVSPFSAATFALPAGSGTHRVVLHVADRDEETRTVDRIALSGPGGATLYDIGSVGLTPQLNPGVAFFDLASILLPNAPWPADLNPTGPLAYAITSGGESAHHRVVLEHSGEGRTLDLNVFFVGIGRTVGARRTLDEMLARYDDILATAGIALGRTRQFEVVGSTASTFAIIDDEMEAGELFLLSAGAARPAVNVFLVESSPLFLGLAGGIPGALDVHGTRASGIVLGFADLEAALMSGFPIEFLSVVLAHEIGHFSGLFHTSESDGSSPLEPLPDTGSCAASRDANGDGTLTADECVGFGGDNIMFWGVIDPTSTFSPSQRDIVSSSPVLLP